MAGSRQVRGPIKELSAGPAQPKRGMEKGQPKVQRPIGMKKTIVQKNMGRGR